MHQPPAFTHAARRDDRPRLGHRRLAMKTRLMARSLAVLVGVWVLGASVGAASALASATASETFASTGGEQTFTVPAGVTSVHVVAIGGRGGSGYAPGPVGGSGAEVTADLSVTPGQVLYVEVAGNGGDGGVDSPGEGGFNGGAAGGLGGGGSGGGASDLRTLSRSASDSLRSRLIAAGGGGGSAGNQMICSGVVRVSGGAGGAAGERGGDGGANSCGGAASAVGWSASAGEAGTSSAGGVGGMSAGDGLSFYELDPGLDGSVGAGGAGAGGQGGGGGGGGGYFGGGGGGGGVINTATMAGGGGGGGGGSSLLAEGTSAGSVAPASTGVPSVRISYGETVDPSPVVSLATPADGSATNDPTPTFSGSAGTAPDDADTVTVKLYAGTSSSGTPVQARTATRQPDGSWAVAAAPSLTDGTYTAQAEQSDAAGNVGSSSAHTFVVDTVAPAPPSSSASPYSNTGVVTVSGTAEADSTIDLYEDGSRVAGTSTDAHGAWSKTLSGVAEGAHTYTATATDEAGNTSGTSNPVTVTVDKTPPDSTITSGPSGPTNDRNPSFTFNGSDALTPASDLLYAVKLDDGNWSAFSPATSATPGGTTGLADGPHTLAVKPRDQAGNEDPTPAQRALVVDTVAPSGTVLINGGASRTGSQSVTLSLNASDPSPATGVTQMRIANSQVELGSAAWTSFATQRSWTLTSGKGTKAVYVQYKDAASNLSPAAQASITYRR